MSPASSELVRVRLAARAGALCVAALIALAAVQRAPLRLPGAIGSLGAPAISVNIEERALPPSPAPHTLPRRIDARMDSASVQEASVEPDGGGALRMWLDGAAGRVVFEHSEDYLRCLDAAIAHVPAPGCPPPPPAERLIGVQSSTGSGLDLNPPHHHH